MLLNRGLRGETPLRSRVGLLRPRIETQAQLCEAEYENIANAIDKYLSRRPTFRTAPFTREWMLYLHHEMFGEVWGWAGEPRTKTETKPIGLPPRMIERELARMIEEIEGWRGYTEYTLEQAAKLHHRAVWIHPFENGNGRWSRLLSQIWQYQNSGTLVIWPETDIYWGLSPLRDKYLDALEEADQSDFDPLIELHRRYTVEP